MESEDPQREEIVKRLSSMDRMATTRLLAHFLVENTFNSKYSSTEELVEESFTAFGYGHLPTRAMRGEVIDLLSLNEFDPKEEEYAPAVAAFWDGVRALEELDAAAFANGSEPAWSWLFRPEPPILLDPKVILEKLNAERRAVANLLLPRACRGPYDQALEAAIRLVEELADAAKKEAEG